MYALVNRINLYYTQYHHHLDETILFLHGINQDHTIFNKLVDSLKDDYRLLLVDLRSHGQSSNISYLEYDDMFLDIKEFIDSLHLKRINIVGFGIGANLALLLATKYPYLIKKLVLCSPYLNLGGYKKIELLKIKKDYLISSDDKTRFKLEAINLSLENLKNIDAQTLILASEHDQIKQSHLYNINDNIKDSELIIYKDSMNNYLNNNKAIIDIKLFFNRKG